jgi:hypothetical protein
VACDQPAFLISAWISSGQFFDRKPRPRWHRPKASAHHSAKCLTSLRRHQLLPIALLPADRHREENWEFIWPQANKVRSCGSSAGVIALLMSRALPQAVIIGFSCRKKRRDRLPQLIVDDPVVVAAGIISKLVQLNSPCAIRTGWVCLTACCLSSGMVQMMHVCSGCHRHHQGTLFCRTRQRRQRRHCAGPLPSFDGGLSQCVDLFDPRRAPRDDHWGAESRRQYRPPCDGGSFCLPACFCCLSGSTSWSSSAACLASSSSACLAASRARLATSSFRRCASASASSRGIPDGPLSSTTGPRPFCISERLAVAAGFAACFHPRSFPLMDCFVRMETAKEVCDLIQDF